MSRAAELDGQHLRSCALRARLFPPSKWAGLFPSAAYRRSAPPPLACGIRTPCGVRCFDVAWAFLRRKRRRSLLPRSWRRADAPLAGWDGLMWLGYFCYAKGQREIKITLAFAASHEARCRMAVFAIQPAGSRTRPASREACRRAAVILRPSRMSPEHPARRRRAVRVQGVTPCLRLRVRGDRGRRLCADRGYWSGRCRH